MMMAESAGTYAVEMRRYRDNYLSAEVAREVSEMSFVYAGCVMRLLRKSALCR